MAGKTSVLECATLCRVGNLDERMIEWGRAETEYGIEGAFTIPSKRWKWIRDYYIPLSLYAWQIKAYPTAKANTTE